MAKDSDLIFDTVAGVIKDNPAGSEHDHLEAFRFEVENSKTLRTALINVVFAGRYPLIKDRVHIVPNMTTIKPAKSRAGSRAPAPPRVARKPLEVSDLVDALRKTVLMDMVLPGGKLLRDAKGRECIKLGGFFGDVGKAIGANQIVGKALRESDLHRILDRQQQPTKKAA